MTFREQLVTILEGCGIGILFIVFGGVAAAIGITILFLIFFALNPLTIYLAGFDLISFLNS